MHDTIIAVVPVHNEVPVISSSTCLDRLLDTLTQARDAGYISQIIAVNDGSRDHTSQVLARHRKDGVYTIDHDPFHPVNRGKAAAFHSAFEYCLALYGNNTVISMLDGDMEFDVRTYRDFLKMIDGRPQVSMAVAGYSQGDDRCPIEHSGARALRVYDMPQLWNPKHRHYGFWQSYFRCADNTFHQQGDDAMNKGFSLEVALNALMSGKRTVENDRLAFYSRERGGGANTLDEINRGVAWGNAFLNEIYPCG